MGHEWIERVIAALQHAGIRTRRGYPAGKAPCLESPASGVSIERLQMDATILAVNLFAPASMGAQVCEDMAVTAVQALKTLGGECRVEKCSFDGKAGLFTMPVYVTFNRSCLLDGWSVKVDGQTQPYARSFKAEYLSEVTRTFNDTSGVPIFSRESDGWRLTIEEILPEERPAENENMLIFSVEYISAGGVQRYEHCVWERILLEPVADGLRRVRVARAARSPIINP